MNQQLLGLLITGSIACVTPEAPNPKQPVFRQVTTRVSTIRLGERWNSEAVPGARSSDTVVSLPAGSFPGAQSVRVHRTPQGVVTMVMCDYQQSADFSAMQAGYSERLGPPVEHEKPSNAEAAERVVWQDKETRFELTRDPKRSVSTVYSRLSDLP
jgi:hypothetical protein